MDSQRSKAAQPAGMPSVDLDSAIDVVAREMTDAEPSGTLRGRVLEQIQGEGRRRPSFAAPRWAWAGAAAAVTLAVVSSMWFATRPAEQVRGPAQLAESRQAPRGASPAVQPGKGAGTAGTTAVTALASRAAAPRTAKAPAETRDEDSHHLPALAEIAPLSFTRVDPGTLQIADVEVASLTAMGSIDIPSLDPDSTDVTTADPKKENRP